MTPAPLPFSLLVGTAMQGGLCAGAYAQSFLDLAETLRAQGGGISYQFVFNESLLTEARNAFAASFLASTHTHLLFIDSHLRFRAGDVLRMLEADKELIAGICPRKELDWERIGAAYEAGVRGKALSAYAGKLEVQREEEDGSPPPPPGAPFRIRESNLGFMLVRRDALEKLRPLVPTFLGRLPDVRGRAVEGAVLSEFFATSTEPVTGRALTGDLHFCALARQHGLPIWAAPWVRLGNRGSFLFEGSLEDLS